MASNDGQGASSKKGKTKNLSQAEIVAQFNQLRQEQRNIATKIGELEMELNEHNVVVGTLRKVDGDRKCFRMIGGVLVERTVKDVLPALESNMTQISLIVEKLKEQLNNKGEEINSFREKHNIKIRGEKDMASPEDKPAGKTGGSQGVLVESSR